MRYLQSYYFFFDSPKWAANLFFATVCQLIPIVGQIVVMGYMYDIIETLHRDPRACYPDFKFQRFVELLTRGLWPWLVALIMQLAIQPFIMVVSYAMMFAMIGVVVAVGEEYGGIVIAVWMPLFYLFVLAFALLMWMVQLPMILRAGLSQDFAQAFKFHWVKDFIVRMWLELILVFLFVLVSSQLMLVTGTLLLLIGMFPAMLLVTLAQGHLIYQTYSLYIARGGEPIPLKTHVAEQQAQAADDDSRSAPADETGEVSNAE